MRHALVVSVAVLATLALLAISCGGSSSETPWPVEPPPAVMSPPGELAPSPILFDDDAGAKPRAKP